jgi:hypothetical protein
MKKEEIIAKIKSLTSKVKTPGRAYSINQREEMKREISTLNVELGKIEFEEDITFINDFLEKHPSHLIPEREELKNNIDEIANKSTDSKLKFVLKYKLKSFYGELDYLSSYQKEIEELIDALNHLNKNEKIPDSNPNKFKSKEEIQKSLAVKFRTTGTKISKLNSILNEIQCIVDFFLNDNKLIGFVYLSNAIFSEASNFEKGYAKVGQGSKKMFFAFNGKTYDIESEESDLPKTQKQRKNPDLIPYEIKDEGCSYLMGYKNSNGEIIIPAKYRNASPFVNGFAKVEIEEKKFSSKTFVKHGLIDANGRLVLHFDNPFFELDNVYNDIVKFKKHIYAPDSYERISSYSFEVGQKSNYLGLYAGYLIYMEIKPFLFNEIEIIFDIEKSIPGLKTNGEVESANEKIERRKKIIDFYIKYLYDNI